MAAAQIVYHVERWRWLCERGEYARILIVSLWIMLMVGMHRWLLELSTNRGNFRLTVPARARLGRIGFASAIPKELKAAADGYIEYIRIKANNIHN